MLDDEDRRWILEQLARVETSLLPERVRSHTAATPACHSPRSPSQNGITRSWPRSLSQEAWIHEIRVLMRVFLFTFVKPLIP